MVKIRLARMGKKKQPTYRLVVSDARKDTLGKYIENLGSYNPSVNPKEINIKIDRVKYWLGVGAQASPTVHNLLVSQGIIKASKVKASKTNQRKNQAKTDDNDAKNTKDKSDDKPEAVAEGETPQPKADEPGTQKAEEKADDKPSDKKDEKPTEDKPEPAKDESEVKT